jgi:glycosyltransferase involved in cell wall biosynthesis
LISVIVPTYNRAALLNKTLNSIFRQTYQDIEVIVLDDGSTDRTAEVVAGYENRKILYINDGRINNVSKLRNKGIYEAKGEFIAFCDDDDIWIENKLEVQLEYLLNHKFVCSNGNVIDENGNILFDSVNYFKKDMNFNLCDLLLDDRILTSSVVSKKSLLESVGGFDEKLGSRSEDYGLWLKIANVDEIRYINRVLISYRKHAQNLSLRSFSDTRELMFKNIEILTPYLSVKNEKISISAKFGLSSIYSKLVRIFFKNNYLSESLRYCWKLLNLYPAKLSFKFVKYIMIYFYLKMYNYFKA